MGDFIELAIGGVEDLASAIQSQYTSLGREGYHTHCTQERMSSLMPICPKAAIMSTSC